MLDAELRWRFLHALAATGHAGESELDAALESDTTASGRARHLTALAARPSAEVKAGIWQRAVHEQALSNELLSAAIEGFTDGSHKLLDPYVEPYFAAVDPVWQDRSIELATRVIRGLFPAGQDLPPGQQPQAHPVVRLADGWLADHINSAPAVRRIIIEQRDHLLRSLRAQALSTASPDQPA